jgi:hypothetical protein
MCNSAEFKEFSALWKKPSMVSIPYAFDTSAELRLRRSDPAPGMDLLEVASADEATSSGNKTCDKGTLKDIIVTPSWIPLFKIDLRIITKWRIF